MSSHDPGFQIFEGAEIFDDVAAGIVEEQLTVLGTADSNDSFEIIPIFEQVVDSLSHAASGDDRDFWTRCLFLLRHKCLG